jgi:DNA-binding winged helix-turn-helix (wHTH) protein
MICERCADEIENAAARPPPEMRGPIWVIAGEKRSVRPIVRRIFKILWSRRDVLVRREAFMTQLYGHRADPPFDGTLDTHLCYLRQALEGSGFGIHTYRGEGWQLVQLSPGTQASEARRSAAASSRQIARRLREAMSR